MTKIDVSIILVNYNTKKMTADCIKSIRRHVVTCNYEIILIDNGSSDGSKELFEQDTELTYIYNDENIGFGRANNIGIKKARGEYLFLLNTDTLLLNDVCSYFIEYERHNENHLVLGAFLIDGYGSPCASYGVFPSIMQELNIALNVYFSRIPFLKRIKHDRSTLYSNLDNINVDYIVGADLFIPKKIIDTCGCFDERFFMYYEETDLQHRFAEHKYIRKIISGPRIVHLCQGSQKKGLSHSRKNLKKNILTDTSKLIYLKKYNNKISFNLFKIIFFFLRLIPIALMPFSIKDKWNYYKIYFKNHL